MSREIHWSVGVKAREIAAVVVAWAMGSTRTPACEAARTMCRLVDKLLSRHSILYRSVILRVRMEIGCNSTDILLTVADGLFSDQRINFGRICALYAFVAQYAVVLKDIGASDTGISALSTTLGDYVELHLGIWMLQHGSWQGFVENFPEPYDWDLLLLKGVVIMTFTVACLLTVGGLFSIAYDG